MRSWKSLPTHETFLVRDRSYVWEQRELHKAEPSWHITDPALSPQAMDINGTPATPHQGRSINIFRAPDCAENVTPLARIHPLLASFHGNIDKNNVPCSISKILRCPSFNYNQVNRNIFNILETDVVNTLLECSYVASNLMYYIL